MASLTQSEYARSRKERGLDGATHTAVQRALDAGRISYVRDSRLIDPVQADKDWAANTDPRPTTKVKKTDPPLDGAENADYGISRAKREFYESELSKLKVQERRGKLIKADVVRKVLYEAGRIIRVGHEDIVAQLSPDLAAETSIVAIEKILKDRLGRLDGDLADRIANLDQTLFDAEPDEDDELDLRTP